MKRCRVARKNGHLTEIERGQIEILVKQGKSITQIAQILGRAWSTIQLELERGKCEQMDSELRIYFVYAPEVAQAKYEEHMDRKQALKLYKCKAFLDFVDDCILQRGMSVEQAVGRARREQLFSRQKMVCVQTLYTYINKGYMKTTNLDLPLRVKRKRARAEKNKSHKRLKGRSIDERPEYINNRSDFGHWEIDCVIGKKSEDDVVLTLTERKTRTELLCKMKGKTVDEVDKALEGVFGRFPDWEKIFKSITSDNGTEFSRLWELEEKRGIKVYYAHPYCSWERGTNERNNGLLRRKIKKGKRIRSVSEKVIQDTEDWLNNLPRKIFNFATAREKFLWELLKIV